MSGSLCTYIGSNRLEVVGAYRFSPVARLPAKRLLERMMMIDVKSASALDLLYDVGEREGWREAQEHMDVIRGAACRFDSAAEAAGSGPDDCE